MTNKKIFLSIFWLILGIILVTLSIMGKIDSSYFAGMGGAFIAIGAMQIMRYIRYSKDSEYKEKIDIKMSDERNLFLHSKAWTITGKTTIVGLAVASIVSFVIGCELAQQIFLFTMCGITMIYFISYLILNKKY